MKLLEIDRVSKQFGGLAALSEVSFDVAEGEIVGLMGANGAGKTTLFALIAGNLRPTAGSIRFAGERIDGLKPSAISGRGIGRTFQIARPFPGLTVRENVAVAVMYGATRERRRHLAEARAEAILESLGLRPRADDPASSLTLAGRKRLEVARALGTGARLLLLDEVMAGLTAAEVTDTIALIRDLRQRSAMTILVVEHVMKALLRLPDRLVVMHHGRVLAVGPPQEVAASEAVIEAYFGRRRP
jgi:branched-chain amino acid transport system ATP-binding protein